MLSRYIVELSETAEAAYAALFDEAQAQLDAGTRGAKQKAAIFRIIDRALDSLAICPYDEKRELMGRPFVNVYVINLDSVCVYYHMDAKHQTVFVRSIEIGKTHPDLSWVRRPEFRNEATEIFNVLGIDGADFLDERPPFSVS